VNEASFTTVSWPAPAKLNLFLHVTGRRPDGYHTLQTLFQFLDVHDDLKFEVTRDGRIERAHALANVPEDSDLSVRSSISTNACHSAAAWGVAARTPPRFCWHLMNSGVVGSRQRRSPRSD
jgi:4-diphosphocytidyl-2-C-methyl-D-erythritol kinase